ncbi:MAG TPA: anthrone oxygenase family protein [Methyloceanibacter sp.]|nr:anthrone oxygenase family protein [Methyloceanibacter sp.]
MDQLLCIATALAVLGSGLTAGVFFAFAAFLLTALGRLPAVSGIVAMQSITSAIKSLLFLLAFFGTAVLAAILGLAAPFRWSEPGSGYLLLGALLYLNLPFAVTLLKNVPLNTKLAGTNADSPEGARFWETFRASWGMWNHLRWIGALAAAAAFLMALVKSAAGA